jgi:hypothetical protein
MNNNIPTFKSNIEAGLIKFPKAAKKRIAIENVTYGVRPENCDMAWNMNFNMDAASYGWPQVVINCMKWIIKENAKVPKEA